jgi:hypothetical protein
VAKEKRLWTVRDSGGFPSPLNADGQRSQPFWSSLSRVEKIIKTVPAYTVFEPFELSWADFAAKWVPGLTRDNVLVGLNWSGLRAVGYDVDPMSVKISVEALFDPSHPWWPTKT